MSVRDFCCDHFYRERRGSSTPQKNVNFFFFDMAKALGSTSQDWLTSLTSNMLIKTWPKHICISSSLKGDSFYFFVSLQLFPSPSGNHITG